MSDDDRWNDDIAYVFSANRTLMQILGIWPLQIKTVFTIIQWSFTTFLEMTMFIFLFMELTGNNRDASTSIESILCVTMLITSILKHICVIGNQRKLAKNIGAAINDWLSTKNDEQAYRIMKIYAFRSRTFSLIILYLGSICFSIYTLGIVFVNVKQIFLKDAHISGNISITEWVFLIPSGDLGKKINGWQYATFIMLQISLLCTLSIIHCAVDSFYINIMMHLTGQLKVLKVKFETFASKPDSIVNNRKHLCRLIDTHCKLAELNQNIEDTFHITILFQLIIVTILLALLGLRIVFCLQNNNYVELSKSSVGLSFLLIQSVVYCYIGDFIQKESQDLFRAMFTSSCFMLPATLLKDLHFVMMRSSYPFRLTGGKFFYVNCKTLLYILKTAVSYISVLRIALKD